MLKIVERLFFWSLKVGVALGMVLSITIAIASVIGSLFVPTKIFGVLLSSVGCFVAGWMFAVFLARTIGFVKQEGASESSSEKKLSEAQKRVTELQNEIDHLKNQRIEINAMQPVLKLGLMDADMSIKDVEIKWMDDLVESKLKLFSAERSQYIGVLQRSFKTTYGIDLMRLRIREQKDCLRVAGIEPESIGFKDEKSKWLIRQRQQYVLKEVQEEPTERDGFTVGKKCYKIDRKKPFKGEFDLNAINSYYEKQEQNLRERMNKGFGEEFANINKYIRKMAEGFIRVLLNPVGKEIVFDSTPLDQIEGEPNWVAIEDYAKEFNQKHESTQKQLPAPDSNIVKPEMS